MVLLLLGLLLPQAATDRAVTASSAINQAVRPFVNIEKALLGRVAFGTATGTAVMNVRIPGERTGSAFMNPR